MRGVLVEDDHSMRQMVDAYAQFAKIDLRSFESIEGFELEWGDILDGGVDFLAVDWRMGGSDGVDLLRSTHVPPGVRKILITAAPDAVQEKYPRLQDEGIAVVSKLEWPSAFWKAIGIEEQQWL